VPFRLPLRELEEASGDPARYRAKLLGPPRQFGGPNYFNALRDAIFQFHKPGETVAEAIAYLHRRLARFGDSSREAEIEDQFRWYVEEYRNLGWPTFRTRLNLEASLPSWAPADLSCSGQVARVDLVPSGGYAGWLFMNSDTRGWRQELRMPLTQEALAREMNATTEEVAVGVYTFQERFVERTSYSAAEIRAAQSSFERLLQRLRL
jgi:hypothetical protein